MLRWALPCPAVAARCWAENTRACYDCGTPVCFLHRHTLASSSFVAKAAGAAVLWAVYRWRMFSLARHCRPTTFQAQPNSITVTQQNQAGPAELVPPLSFPSPSSCDSSTLQVRRLLLNALHSLVDLISPWQRSDPVSCCAHNRHGWIVKQPRELQLGVSMIPDAWYLRREPTCHTSIHSIRSIQPTSQGTLLVCRLAKHALGFRIIQNLTLPNISKANSPG